MAIINTGGISRTAQTFEGIKTFDTQPITVSGFSGAQLGCPMNLPMMTTGQRDALVAGDGLRLGSTIYNSTTNKINVYTASGWEAVTSA